MSVTTSPSSSAASHAASTASSGVTAKGYRHDEGLVCSLIKQQAQSPDVYGLRPLLFTNIGAFNIAKSTEGGGRIHPPQCLPNFSPHYGSKRAVGLEGLKFAFVTLPEVVVLPAIKIPGVFRTSEPAALYSPIQ